MAPTSVAIIGAGIFVKEQHLVGDNIAVYTL
jgi:hypothetical protein